MIEARLEDQVTWSDLGIWCGKTSPEPFPPHHQTGGADFQAVLTEIVRIAEPEAADVPMPEKGRWPYSGCIYDELGRWSVAWRLHDAQFWGVPQRRKRIALVADFGGLSAAEILFERKGLRWNPEQSEQEGKETPGRSSGSTGESDQ